MYRMKNKYVEKLLLLFAKNWKFTFYIDLIIEISGVWGWIFLFYQIDI